jgi:hypothetical protein
MCDQLACGATCSCGTYESEDNEPIIPVELCTLHDPRAEPQGHKNSGRYRESYGQRVLQSRRLLWRVEHCVEVKGLREEDRRRDMLARRFGNLMRMPIRKRIRYVDSRVQDMRTPSSSSAAYCSKT